MNNSNLNFKVFFYFKFNKDYAKQHEKTFYMKFFFINIFR